MRVVPIVCLFALPACEEPGGDSTPTDPLPYEDSQPETSGLAIVGVYTDAFGSTHTIEEDGWEQRYAGYDPLVFEILSFDNATSMLVARNAAENAYDPGRFSRFDWLDAADGHLYYCQTAFDAETEEDAAATPRADDADLAAGCGGFAWTDLTP